MLTQRRSHVVWLSAAAQALLACSNTVTTEPATPSSAHASSEPPPSVAAFQPTTDGGAGSSDGDVVVLLDDSAPVRGIACGVALPVVCAAVDEKCCARSLSVDSCIPSAAACSCDLDGCKVIEARCDGPEDCKTGESCCGTLTPNAENPTGYSTFVCAARCVTERDQREACHGAANTCPQDLICAQSQFLTNMHICVDASSLMQ